MILRQIINNNIMAHNNTDYEKAIIFKGTDLKYLLKIEAEGFSMDDDDFKVILRNSFGTKKVEIEKSQMLKSGDDGYIFTFSTDDVGTNEIIMTTIAYVPDSDFEDGIRTEVERFVLCIIK